MLRRIFLCRNLRIPNRPRSSPARGQAAISLAPILTDFALECELRSHWSRFLPELREYTRSFIPTTNMAAHLSVILQAKFVKQRMNLTPLLPITSANCQKPSFMKAWWPKLNLYVAVKMKIWSSASLWTKKWVFAKRYCTWPNTQSSDVFTVLPFADLYQVSAFSSKISFAKKITIWRELAQTLNLNLIRTCQMKIRLHHLLENLSRICID